MRDCIKQADIVLASRLTAVCGYRYAVVAIWRRNSSPGPDHELCQSSSSPCFQCLYNEQDENVKTCEMEGKLWLLDGLNVSWQPVQLAQNPQCPVCSNQ